MPVYPTKPAATTAIAVVDHRLFILHGEKEEWFEGIFRSGFGVPYSIERPGKHAKRPFALSLSTMLKDSVEDADGKATIIRMPMGTSLEDSIAAMTKNGADAGPLVMMYQSRYEILVQRVYNYDFEVVVLDRHGKTLAKKRFHSLDNIEVIYEYTMHDWITATYKQKFDSFSLTPKSRTRWPRRLREAEAVPLKAPPLMCEFGHYLKLINATDMGPIGLGVPFGFEK